MKTKLNITLFLVLMSMTINAQELPKVVPPSPEASNVFKFTEVPVSLYTGIPNINIPLLEIESGGVVIPISMSYHARGIQVAEMAPRVGLGWALNAGGIISKQVRDKDDAEVESPDYNIFFTNEMERQITLSKISNHSPIDLIPDQYSFSVNGMSGKMIHGRNGEGWLTQNYSDIKVSPSQITDNKGNKYLFGVNNDFDIDTTIENRTIFNNSYSLGTNYVPPIKNTSHLSRIETISGKTINFLYEEEVVYFHRRGSDNNYAPDNESSVSIIQSKQQRIDQIIFDEGLVLFEYDSNSRLDMLGSNSLKKIILKNIHGQVIKQIIFDYEYTTSTDLGNMNWYLTNFSSYETSESARKRLFLKSIKIFDNTNNISIPYRFEYNPIVLPSRFSNSVDAWGYYNGKNNGAFLEIGNDDRTVDVEKVQAGMLTSIINPSGGKTNFYYEPNIAVNVFPETIWFENPNPSTQKNVILTPLVATATTNNIDQETGEPYYKENGLFEDVFIISEFQKGDITYNSFGSGVANCRCDNDPSCLPQNPNSYCLFTREIFKWDLSTNSYKFFTNLFTVTNRNLVLSEGKYKLVVKYKNSNQSYVPGNIDEFFSVNIIWYEEITGHINTELSCGSESYTGTKIVYAAGNRIKKIEYKKEDDSIDLIKTYSYLKPNSSETSGRLLGLTSFAEVTYFDMNGQSVTVYNQSVPISSMFSTYQSNSVGYKNVTEYYGDGINNIGKTEYQYSMVYDTGRYYDFPFHPPTDNEWLRGKELSVKHYKKTGIGYEIIQEKANTYIFANNFEYTGIESLCNHPFLKPSEINPIGQDVSYSGVYEKNNTFFRIPLAILPINTNSSSYKTYYFTGGAIDLKSTKVTEYFDNGQEMETITTYGYDYNNHYNVANTSTVNSLGETSETKYYYAKNLSNPINDSLVAKNIVAIPLKTETFKNEEKLSTIETQYKNWDNILLAPKFIKASKGTAPLETRVIYNLVDSTNGNPLQVQQEGGMTICYIWGYNKTQPVAKIENIAYSSIPTSHIHAIETASNSNNEASLITALNALRNDVALSNTMITTYTYKPLVGISTVTDPKGDKHTYHYDGFGRLEFVKDAQGNILSENKYHYRTQN